MKAMNARYAAVMAVAVGVGLGSSALGADTLINWSTSASTSAWGTVGNWEGSIPGTNDGVTNSDDVAVFRPGRPITTIIPDANRRIKELLFAGSAPAYTIGTTGGPALTMSSLTGTPSIVGNAGNAVNNTFNMPIIFLGSGALTAADGSTLTFNGTISTPTGSASTLGFGNHSGTIRFNDVISGDAAFSNVSNAATGPRLVEFKAANTFTGGVTLTPVHDAVILANNTTGSATGSGDVAINKGTLGGNGFIVNGSTNGVTVGATGHLSPGASAGAVGTLTMNLGSKGLDITGAVAATNTQSLLFDLATPASSDKVSLLSTSVLKIGTGALEWDDFAFNLPGGPGSLAGGTYTLFDSSQLISGSLGSSLSGTLDGKAASLSLADGGKDIVLTVVPEPATLGLLAIGGLGLLARRRRA